ncbi:hypothetical protein FEDK69T_03610 [Flavobacterium enshiense DK69]|uniref:Uncharacterized protein n=1 Tax=Flavobacterium enshiense DK69 TaxID=1107311 RepID=V6SDQ3_9FLAO|nr:hypothetical protein [Flavobacterium enshiense]ESU24808.1 hypothetical protein FEDK69T_03610 [Flavobacterium enshiense DK69]KGO96738.1 hypothetical protein Q767_03245 [Flavobacterium enshiense DK69]
MKQNYITKTVYVATLLFIQVGYAQVGIGTTNPLSTLHVQGTMRVTDTNNTTATTKLTGTDASGILCDIKVGQNLYLVGNELNGKDGDNSVFKVASKTMAHTTSNFEYNDWDLKLTSDNAGVVIMRLAATGPINGFEISGISGGTNGRHIILYNATTANMKINHLDSSSASANQIDTTGGATATSGVGLVDMVYDGASQKWIVVSIRD